MAAKAAAVTVEGGMAGAVKEAVMEVVEKVGGARAGAMAAVETEVAARAVVMSAQ